MDGLNSFHKSFASSQIPVECDLRQCSVQSYLRIHETFIPQLASGLLLINVHNNTPSGPRRVCSGVSIYVRGLSYWISQKQTLK